MTPPRQLLDTIAAALGTPVESLSSESGLNRHPAWDSLGHVQVLLALETHFRIRLADETLDRLTSVSAIAEYLAVPTPLSNSSSRPSRKE